ncbi:MAG TPA: TonB family protein [Candidatus Dormibacteraeota bacterium]|jgi:TonB family protein|nr:TonB family protein [Candidatus Dormibacteraeota bacterium]
MSTPTLWKKWEGRVVEGKFPLRQWLGSSDHSAVFLTERIGKGWPKAAIKLIRAGDLDHAAQFSRWAGAARLSRPHLIRLMEWGHCQIDDTRLLYVVIEYAEENLSEILPLRPLSANEASEMLRPAAEALASLHQSGLVHGRIKPSNILAVDNQVKISSDSLCKIGERDDAHVPSAYDAPEVAATGPSPAADVWSLGMTLVAVLTQNEPKVMSGGLVPGSVPETLPQPLREIARKCLRADPLQRGTATEIVSQLTPQVRQAQAPRDTAGLAAKVRPARSKRWIVLSLLVAAFLLVALLVFKSMVHQPEVPATETHAATQPAEIPAVQSPAPFSGDKKPTQKGVVRGSVLQQVLPDVSRSAQNTITGRFRVSVQVEVDAAGKVSQAKLVSPGPSPYFASHTLAAARLWKFNPAQVDGEAVASVWTLRFQFSRANIQVLPTEVKP